MEEHPDITYANATGYPRGEEPKWFYCQTCGCELLSDELYQDEDHTCLCEECLLTLHKRGDNG